MEDFIEDLLNKYLNDLVCLRLFLIHAGTDVNHVLNVSAEDLKTFMETMAKTTLTSYQVRDLCQIRSNLTSLSRDHDIATTHK